MFHASTKGFRGHFGEEGNEDYTVCNAAWHKIADLSKPTNLITQAIAINHANKNICHIRTRVGTLEMRECQLL